MPDLQGKSPHAFEFSTGWSERVFVRRHRLGRRHYLTLHYLQLHIHDQRCRRRRRRLRLLPMRCHTSKQRQRDHHRSHRYSHAHSLKRSDCEYVLRGGSLIEPLWASFVIPIPPGSIQGIQESTKAKLGSTTSKPTLSQNTRKDGARSPSWCSQKDGAPGRPP